FNRQRPCPAAWIALSHGIETITGCDHLGFTLGCLCTFPDQERDALSAGRSVTILVTGGAGYIGSHMVHELVDAGERVVVLDNLTTGFRFLIPPSVPFVAGSTGDRPLVGEVIARHRVSAIIHFAASIVVPESVTDPLGYYSNNTMNTCALLDVAAKAG